MFTELENKINEQKEDFTKELKIIEKKQAETLELKNSLKEMKNGYFNHNDTQ